MPVSGKKSILNGIFRVWCVPQEPQSPLVKHRQVSGHNAVQFLGALAKDAAANCWLSFNERCYRRHNRILSMLALPPFPASNASGNAMRRPHAMITSAFLGERSRLSSRLDEPLQHGFQRDFSLTRTSLSALELDPAFVEAIQHSNTGRGILHPLRSNSGFPSLAPHALHSSRT